MLYSYLSDYRNRWRAELFSRIVLQTHYPLQCLRFSMELWMLIYFTSCSLCWIGRFRGCDESVCSVGALDRMLCFLSSVLRFVL
jgi:hypothetical protein